jgi:cytochrome P450
VTAAGEAGISYDPYDVGISADPYPTYRRLRDEAPISFNERSDVWALSRHADVEEALVDWQTFSSGRSDILEVIQSRTEVPAGVVLFEDPPLHAMHRGLMSRIFTPRRMKALEEEVRAFCTACLDPLVGRDRFDFMADLGAELPMRALGMLLGIRPMDLDADAIADGDLGEYVEWRADHPSDDLVTALLRAPFEDEHGTVRTLTREEVLTCTQVLAWAGNETTGRQIGWLGKILGEHPDQRRELVADRSLLPNAIEEALRYEPTGPHVARYVTRDVELHGTTVPAGSAMLLLIGSANRDERRYEDPDRFDIHRDLGQHLTFGHGVHHCLGAALARLECRVALDEVLDRFPDWEVDHADTRFVSTSTMRGWSALPVFVG